MVYTNGHPSIYIYIYTRIYVPMGCGSANILKQMASVVAHTAPGQGTKSPHRSASHTPSRAKATAGI